MTSSFSTLLFHPVLTSGQDLFPVVPDSTLSGTGCLLSVGVLNHVSVTFKLFL